MENKTKSTANSKRIIIIVVACFAVLALLATGLYFAVSDGTSGGEKMITINVNSGSYYNSKTVTTSEKYLGSALRARGLIGGVEQETGFFVTSVFGVFADNEDGYYWMVYKDGELLPTGVDKTPIKNGDVFDFKCEQYSF